MTVPQFEDFEEEHCRRCELVCNWQWDDEEEGIGHCAKGRAQSFDPYSYTIPVFVAVYHEIANVSDICETCRQRCRYNQHQKDAGDA